MIKKKIQEVAKTMQNQTMCLGPLGVFNAEFIHLKRV